MKKLSQKGFTIVEGLLLFVIVAVIFGVGFYVYRQTRGNDDLAQQSNKPAQKVDKEPDEPEPEADKPPEQKFLEINELGVKMPLDATISDAYYYIYPSRPQYAYLSTRSLEGVDLCAANKTSLGVLSKMPVSSYDDAAMMTYGQMAQAGAGTIIGANAYNYTQAQASCVHDPNSANYAKQPAILSAFKAAAKQLQSL